MDTDALAGAQMKPEEEAAARGVDLGAKAFSSAAPPPRLYGEAYTPTSTPGPSPAPSPAKPFENNGGDGGAGVISGAGAGGARGGGGYGGGGGGKPPPFSPEPPMNDDGDGWGDLEDEVGLCRLNQVDPYPVTYSLSNP